MDSLEDGRFIQSKDDHKLYCRYWRPETDKPRALVFISHGFGEHVTSYYDHVAKALTGAGVFVFAHDHEGHGKSDGTRVLVSSFDVYVRDIWTHIDDITSRIPGVPVFIVGHSMGGLIAVYCGLERKNTSALSGTALISPCLHIDPDKVTPCKKRLGGIMSTIFPSFQLDKVDPKYITRNEKVVKKYDDDPLVWHGGIKAGQGMILLQAMESLWTKMASVTWPLLVLHGTADAITDVRGSQRLDAEAASTDKTLVLYEDAYHQLHNEPDGLGEQCIQRIVEWITIRT